MWVAVHELGDVPLPVVAPPVCHSCGSATATTDGKHTARSNVQVCSTVCAHVACAAPECVLGAGHHHPYCCRYETGQARHHFLYEQGLHLQRKQHHVCIQVPQPTDVPRELTSCCYSREHDVDMGEGAAAKTMPAAKRQKRVHAEVYPADISSALFFESTCDTVLTCPCCWQPALIP